MSKYFLSFDKNKCNCFLSDGNAIKVDMNNLLRIYGENGCDDILSTLKVISVAVNGDSIDTCDLLEIKEESKVAVQYSNKNTNDWYASLMIEKSGENHSYLSFITIVKYVGDKPKKIGYQINVELKTDEAPQWLVPGLFYGVNRLDGEDKLFPKFVSESKKNVDTLESNQWSFRSDRTSVPSVMARTGETIVGLATDEYIEHTESGIGFGYYPNHKAYIRLLFPYTEEPVVYFGEPVMKEKDIPLMVVEPQEEFHFGCQLYWANGDKHKYDSFIRELYYLHLKNNKLAETEMNPEKISELTSEGLYRWHYHPEHHVLYETAAFDRGLGGNVDRPHMHVSWVSGAPYCFALLKYANRMNNEKYYKCATDVLDFICSSLSPLGTFWAEWTLENGFGTGWNPKKNWLQARTLSEATLFFIRALREEKKYGRHHTNWEKAVISNITYALSTQNRKGKLGSYYCIDDGKVESWEGTGGILWIAALVEAGDFFKQPDYLSAAEKAGQAYQLDVLNEYLYGAPEDISLCPSSEDGYNAILAYHALFKATKDKKWLDLAKHSVEWTMTFRYTYNVHFSEETFLGKFDFQTRGADNASPANNHLHCYGLICLGELFEISEWTQDRYFYDRATDHFECFKQAIVKEDGHLNGYKGMVSERFYQTNAFQPKGMMLGLSHSWCVGVLLYASEVMIERGDIIIF